MQKHALCTRKATILPGNRQKWMRYITKSLLVMKLTVLFLTVLFLNVSASSVSQTITLSGKNMSLVRVFSEIEKQTGYVVVYPKVLLEGAGSVTLSVENMPIAEFLKVSLKSQPMDFSIDNKTILIAEKVEGVPDPADRRARAGGLMPSFILINGKITDADGRPVSGVSVIVKGTATGTTTDANGDFSINAEKGVILVVSSVEFETKEIRAEKASGLTIILNRAVASLNEVVVNKGYYNTTRALNTGNVSSVSSKSIEQQPVSNPLAALQGQVPGMFITQGSGIPGSSFKVQIRGQNSIASGNDPFYVIDGVPFATAPELQENNNLNPAGGSPLNFINTHDIESIEVLKDADATAIYGSRGANGVVLITTKKGKAGQTKADFNVYQGAGKLTHSVKYLNTQQYLEMRNEAFKNDGAVPDAAVDQDVLGGNTWNPDSYTDWQKQLIGGTSRYTDAQATVSGGSELVQYTAGGGYHRETTVFPGTGSDQKASMHFNISSTSRNQKFRMNFSGNYVADFTTLPKTDLTSQITYLAPNAPAVYNADGTLNWADGTWLNGNPYSYLGQSFHGRTTNLLTNLTLSYNIFKGLDFRTNLGYTNLQTNQKTLVPLTTINPLTGATSGSSSFNDANTRSWIAEPQLSYKTKIGKSGFSAMIGSSFQQSHNEGLLLAANGFSSDLLLGNVQAASTVKPIGVTDIFYKYNALYGRLNYSYDDKYVLNLTARRDGSSRFGPGKQFANFGAVGAAWIFTKEQWVADHLRFLSFGKLRGSYGTSGNDQMEDYGYLDRYNSTTNTYGGTQGIYPANFPNPLLAWEQNKKMEAGLELGFLNDHINFSVSYYRNRSSNQLIEATLSVVTGFPFISENLPATVQNTGVEIAASSVNIKTGKFKWTTSANLTVPRNKLIAFPDLASSSYSERFIIGQPITIGKGFVYAGVDPATGLYQMMGKDGKLTSDPIPGVDDIRIIDLAPKYYGGLQNSLSYGQFSLDFLFQFVKQKGNNFLYVPVGELPGTYSANQPEYVIKHRWQKPGDIADIQRFNQDYSTITSSNAAVTSDHQYGDASFARLKNLSLSYTLSSSWLQRLRLQNARIYFQGQNLLTITNYIGYDPETQYYQTLPPLKVWTMGLQITL